ncbi:hypothetical protein ACFP63_08620 [Oerskovia jenensis]|uniref:Minor tail protein n=1 Tax=Oerskovia jenensis TaxID=162169 RepID=A0ABS2LI63_9CELL|nr:hypothetical protein [Oerskovia jenensis]MBM7480114.1 hypothetical protein [Oerskovia jenensis]
MGDLSVVRLRAGVVVTLEGVPGHAVNIDGSTPPVAWPAGYIPTVGDPVRVLMVDGEAVVLGPVIRDGLRPLTGTVQGAATSGTVPVTTTAGLLQCRYVGTAPSIGSLVRLDWQSTAPWIWPSAAATIPPPLPGGGGTAPEPPPVSTSGTLTVTAIDSGSWQVGGSWAWAGTDVYQWRYGSARENRGAWFYGAAASQLAGATITGARIRLGARLRIGNYNGAAALHLYRHTNPGRPDGDVNRAAGPHDITLGPNAGPGWVTIPTEWGQALISGGGIAVTGSPYVGIAGVGSDPASGQLQLDWRR